MPDSTQPVARRWCAYPAISTDVDAGSNATDALTEAKLLELGEDCYTNGSDPSVFMIKPADAQIVSGFTGSAGRNRTINDGQRTLVNAIDLYVSPYGEYRVILNRHQKTTHAFLIDPSMFRSACCAFYTDTVGKFRLRPPCNRRGILTQAHVLLRLE